MSVVIGIDREGHTLWGRAVDADKLTRTQVRTRQ